MTYLLFSITQEYESGPVQSDHDVDLCRYFSHQIEIERKMMDVINSPISWEKVKPKTYVQPGLYWVVALGCAYMGWIAWGISR